MHRRLEYLLASRPIVVPGGTLAFSADLAYAVDEETSDRDQRSVRL